MELNTALNVALKPAWTLLAPHMRSQQAKVMLLAIGGQESGFRSRTQVPVAHAHGFWQFEIIGVRGVLEHHTTSRHATRICEALTIHAEARAVYEAIVHNDVLAACFARLLLWQHPGPMPETMGGGWDYYVDQWKPGKPHPERWAEHWNAAQAAVAQEVL